MSKILWHVTMSLDGFTTGPDEDPGWAFRRPLGRVPLAAEIPGRVGAILAGRRWYDVGLRHDEASYAPYGGSLAVPVFVLTHTPPARAERVISITRTALMRPRKRPCDRTDHRPMPTTATSVVTEKRAGWSEK